jgi:hypothetical protein
MPTSQSARSITGHLCHAATAIDHRRDLETARIWIADACFEALGHNPQLSQIIDLVARAMSLQRDACRDELL